MFKKCPLWDYRLGHNPMRKGIGRGIGYPFLQKNTNSANDFL